MPTAPHGLIGVEGIIMIYVSLCARFPQVFVLRTLRSWVIVSSNLFLSGSGSFRDTLGALCLWWKE